MFSMDAFGLKGKRALITGAATGIGRATAKALAQAGCDVAINYYQSEDEARELAQEICRDVETCGKRTLILQADISNEAEVQGMFKKIRDSWGALDILVNNAGLQKKSPSHETSLEEFQKVIATNLTGTFLCSREAIRMFLSGNSPGVIINNTSVHQLIPKPGYLSYSMSKGAVANLTRTLALEYADRGIRVNAVAPGAIATPINPWSTDQEEIAQIEDHIPVHAVGKPEDIARCIVFLASSDSSYVTGQTLFADGGLSLYPDFSSDWSSS